MSATPEPEVRYWQDEDGALWHTTTAAGHLLAERDESWREVTVTPVVPQGAATPADERLCEAADRRGFVMLRDTMPLAEVLGRYRDGDEIGWDVEFAALWALEPQRMRDLVASIRRAGIREPILLGNDGRIWDGHHRLAAANRMGLARVPVVAATSEEADRG